MCELCYTIFVDALHWRVEVNMKAHGMGLGVCFITKIHTKPIFLYHSRIHG